MPAPKPPSAPSRALYAYSRLESLTGGWDANYKLGSGGSGTVYKATLDGTPVAIKRLHGGGAASAGGGDGGASASFHHELELLSATSHSNVVPLLGASSDGAALCLVYMFCDGGSVEQRLARTLTAWPLPLSAVQRMIIASDVCRGLAFLHGLGIVHRDIKPANLLLQQVQQGLLARIGDFGVARALEAEAQAAGSGTMMTRTKTWQGAQAAGTLAYMAPEYLKAPNSTPKVDSFAFGLTLVVLLTGRPAEKPVQGPSGETFANLLELWYDELAANVDALAQMLDTARTVVGVGAGMGAGVGAPAAHLWEHHPDAVRVLHGIAGRCLEHRARPRAEVRDLVDELERARHTAETSSAASPKDQKEHPEEFCCPLSLEMMVDPVVAADGFTYERCHIERWIRGGGVSSPMTGQRLPHTKLTPNLTLKAMIKAAMDR
jgi:serine/threonine protein kinase